MPVKKLKDVSRIFFVYTIGIYIAILHGILALLVVRPYYAKQTAEWFGFAQSFPNRYFNNMVTFHQRVSGNLPDGSVIFIGDSIIQGLAVNAVADRAVNFGIGGDTTTGAVYRIKSYQNMEAAASIVIAIGINDLAINDKQTIAANITRILNELPAKTLVLLSAILPVDESLDPKLEGYNQRIIAINQELRKLAVRNTMVKLVNIGHLLIDSKGQLRSEFHVGDGLHLNSDGYTVFINELKRCLGNDW
jgi:lysophospholipase L1-like esterase